VYERILEHGLRAENGSVVVAEKPGARKSSGSYYTPEQLVGLIIERAVGLLVSDRLKQFIEKAAALGSNTRGKERAL